MQAICHVIPSRLNVTDVTDVTDTPKIFVTDAH